MFFNPINPIIGNTITINAKIRNIGLEEASNFHIGFYHDANCDSAIQPQEIIGSLFEINDPFAVADSITISQNWFNFKQGINKILVNIIYPEDQNNDNNIAGNQLNV